LAGDREAFRRCEIRETASKLAAGQLLRLTTAVLANTSGWRRSFAGIKRLGDSR